MSEGMTDDERRDELERDILRLAKRVAEPTATRKSFAGCTWALEDAGRLSGDDNLIGSRVAVLRDKGGAVVMVASPDRLSGAGV